jgi:hypothetical protein
LTYQRRAALGWKRLSAVGVIALTGAFSLVGCASSSHAVKKELPPAVIPAKHTSRSRFVLVVLENREFGEVIGSSPYIDHLARRYALATNYYAITHPSLPNYIALVSGGTRGIASDCTDCTAHGPTVVEELEARKVSWGAYMQGLPRPCFLGATDGEYAKKHDPFLYFPQIVGNPSRCNRVQPLADLATELRAGTLPSFVWITPGLCADGHNCGNGSVEAFLKPLVRLILPALGPKGTLAITWDEGSTDNGCCKVAAGGRVALLLVGPQVRPHFRLMTPADHYSLLALIARSFGVRPPGEAACSCTPSLRAVYRGRRVPRLGGT